MRVSVSDRGIVLQAVIDGIFPHQVNSLFLIGCITRKDSTDIILFEFSNTVKRRHRQTDKLSVFKYTHRLHTGIAFSVKVNLNRSDVTLRASAVLSERLDQAHIRRGK